MSVYENVLSSMCAVYTLLSGAYTLVGTRKLLASGVVHRCTTSYIDVTPVYIDVHRCTTPVAAVSCVFPTAGSFSLAFVVTAGSGRSTGYSTCSGGVMAVA